MKKILAILCLASLPLVSMSCKVSDAYTATNSLLTKKKWKLYIVDVYDNNGNSLKSTKIKYLKNCTPNFLEFKQDGSLVSNKYETMGNDCKNELITGKWTLGNDYILTQKLNNGETISNYLPSITNVTLILESPVSESDKENLPAGATKYRYYYEKY